MLAFVRRNTIGFIALVIALGGTGAYAVNTVRSSDIVDGQVKTQDLANGAVTPAKAPGFRMFTEVNVVQTRDCYGGAGQWRDCAPVTITVPPGGWRVTVTSTVEGDPGTATVQAQFCPAETGPTCIWLPHWATFFPRGVTSSTATAQTNFAGGPQPWTFTYVTAVRFSGPILSDAYTTTRVDVYSTALDP